MKVVRRHNEQDLLESGNVEIVIGEGIVLLGIEDL